MDALPVDLLKQIHPVYGGAIGFGVWFAFQLWRAWKEWKKEQRDSRAAEVAHETARQGRLTSGFAALDASRDKQIAELTKSLEAIQRQHDTERTRWAEDLARERAEHARTIENREEGWDKGRGMEDEAHDQRHGWGALVHAIYSAGRLNLPMPDAVLRIYEAGRTGGAIPPDLNPPMVPALQDVTRKRPN